MNVMFVDILGAGWITAAGAGSAQSGHPFSMPQGRLPALRHDMLAIHMDTRWGRLDIFSKLGLIASSLALHDAGIIPKQACSATGLFVSSVIGSLDVDHAYYRTVLSHGGAMASPNLFAYTLPTCMLGEISILYGFTGPSLVVGQTNDDMLCGVRAGLNSLYYGLCEQVVAGYCNTEFHTNLPGAVFLVMRKAASASLFSFNGTDMMHNSNNVATLFELMRRVV